MEARNGVLLGIVVVAIAVGVYFAVGFRGEAVPPPHAAKDRTANAAAVTATVGDVAPASAEPARANGSDAASTTTTERQAVEAIDPKNATVHGRCVDGSGAPLADCQVSLQGWGGNQQRTDAWLVDHESLPKWRELAPITTGADGRFAFTFWPPPPCQFALDLRGDGFAALGVRWSSLAEGSTTDVGDVAMLVGVRVTGRVVDEDGVPQADEQVGMQRADRSHELDGHVAASGSAYGSTQPDGSFAMNDLLVPGRYEIWTRKPIVSPKTVELAAERRTEEVAIVVGQTGIRTTITGRVVDETGAPAPGVSITSRSERRADETASESNGTFELFRSDDDREPMAHLVLSATDYDVEATAPRDVAWNTTDVEFQVVRAGALTLRVTDAQRQPVESYAVRMIPRHRQGSSSTEARVRASGHHDDGLTTIPGLGRGDWLVLVDFPEASGLMSLFEPLTQERTGPRRLDLVADAPAHRMLRVVGADGEPVAGSVVQLCMTFDRPFDGSAPSMARDLWFLNSSIGAPMILFTGETGRDGRLELAGPPGVPLGLDLLGPNHVPQRLTEVRLETPGELLVRVDRGARLMGRIVPPEALAELKRLAGADASQPFPQQRAPRLTFTRDGGQHFPDSPHVSTGAPDPLSIADDGTFDISGVPPGSWHVNLQAWLMSGRAGTSRQLAAGEVTLVDGETTHQDLELSRILPGTLEGLVLLNGKILADTTVSMEGTDSWTNLTTDAEGRIRWQGIPGEYHLIVQLARQGKTSALLHCATPAVVVRGETNRQTIDVRSGTLRVRLRDTQGKPVVNASLRVDAGGARDTILPATDAQGLSEIESTAGTVSLRILPKALSTREAQQNLWQEASARGDKDPLARHWITLATVALIEGTTQTAELTLPAEAGY